MKIDIEDELHKILAEELKHEYGLSISENMLSVAFPNKSEFLTFTKLMKYDSELLPHTDKVPKYTYYELMNIMYLIYQTYHTK